MKLNIIHQGKLTYICVSIILFQIKIFSQPLAIGHSKFLGNVYGSTMYSHWDNYWNQVTPENAGKWQYIEPSRDQYSWGGLDAVYNFAKQRGIPFKMHTLVWGQQYPTWIDALPPAEQREEVEEWFALVGARYPDVDLIDVVNEPLSNHAPATYREALGGSGSTGWDWVIWCFEKARQYMPNAKLILNEYNLLNSYDNTNVIVQIANILKSRGLIDGIGVQAHCFEIVGVLSYTITNNLNTLANTGLPIYISEMDIGRSNKEYYDEDYQLSEYKRIFPILWEHPAVKGITLWGYLEGAMWQNYCYLLKSNLAESKSLVWLRNYLTNGGYRTCQTGNWDSLSTWEKFVDSVWVPASSIPRKSDRLITIRNGHVVEITGLLDTVDQVYVQSGGTLAIRESGTLVIDDGPGSDLEIGGVLSNSGNILLTSNEAELKVLNGGRYIHLRDGGGRYRMPIGL